MYASTPIRSSIPRILERMCELVVFPTIYMMSLSMVMENEVVVSHFHLYNKNTKEITNHLSAKRKQNLNFKTLYALTNRFLKGFALQFYKLLFVIQRPLLMQFWLRITWFWALDFGICTPYVAIVKFWSQAIGFDNSC